MSTLTNNNQVADGNNNAAGLALWSAVTDANSIAFVMPRFKGTRNRGVKRVRLNSTQGIIGKDSGRLVFAAITIAQYKVLIDTYEGLVTLKIPLDSSTYANYNAVMVVPDEEELDYRPRINSRAWGSASWPGYLGVEVIVRKLEAL